MGNKLDRNRQGEIFCASIELKKRRDIPSMANVMIGLENLWISQWDPEDLVVESLNCTIEKEKYTLASLALLKAMCNQIIFFDHLREIIDKIISDEIIKKEYALSILSSSTLKLLYMKHANSVIQFNTSEVSKYRKRVYSDIIKPTQRNVARQTMIKGT